MAQAGTTLAMRGVRPVEEGDEMIAKKEGEYLTH